MPEHDTGTDPTLNRAGRRLEAKRGRKLAALGSGIVLATSAAGVVAAAAPAGAAVITVTSLDDNGAGTLRQALADADDGDTIDLRGLSGTIELTNGSLDIEDLVTIVGPGSGALTVDANGTGRVFTQYSFIGADGTVTISGLTLTGGDADPEDDEESGGAIYFACWEKTEGDEVISPGFNGSLVLDDVVVTGNTAPSLGGGIYFDVCYDGDLTITNSVIAGNTSSNSDAGGIWFDDSDRLTITNTTVADNTVSASEGTRDGGGILMDDNTNALVILNSTVAGNSASGAGGGLWSATTGTVTIANSTFTGNSAGGDGGGIAAADGGLTVLQSTISGNTAADVGDGVYLAGYELIESTTERQQNGRGGGGGRVGAAAVQDPTLTGTIVAGNGDGTNDIGTGSEDEIEVTVAGSVLGGLSSGVVVTDGGGNQLGVTDPGLEALADNGGPTQTMALKATSVALDAGPDPVADFPGNDNDQRGAGYPRIVNGRVDVGAFEVQPVTIEPNFTG